MRRAHKFFILPLLIYLWAMQGPPAHATCGHCPGDQQSSSSAPSSSKEPSAATVPTTQSTTSLNSPVPSTTTLGANAGVTFVDVSVPPAPGVTGATKDINKALDDMFVSDSKGVKDSKANDAKVGDNNRGIDEQPGTDGSTVRTFTDSQGRRTREERMYGRDGARAITDYDPVTQKIRSNFRTSASGHPKYEAQYDGSTGMKISETKYDENGREKDHRTWDPDGVQSSAVIREDDGTITRQSRVPGGRSVISRTRPDGSLVSTKEDTGPMQSRVREFDNKNNMTSEQNISHGMATSKTTYGENGVSTINFYPDGSVKSQTQTVAGGKTTTADYPAGEYFEQDGGVRQIQ